MPDFIRVRFKDSGTEQTIAKPAAIDTSLMVAWAWAEARASRPIRCTARPATPPPEAK